MAPSSPPEEEEQQYLNLVTRILDHGEDDNYERTGVGTRVLIGETLKFSLRNRQVPLLTTKRMFWRGICEELLFFVAGKTDNKLLQEKNVHIWDAHASTGYLAKRFAGTAKNIDREEGDLGPIYGFQWRHFNADYHGCHADYSGQGVDQLATCIRTLRNWQRNGTGSRRVIMSAWNPCQLDEMSLPPCHVLCQFHVHPNDESLSCIVYQRSADVGLGLPFNIASYALLAHLVAAASGLSGGARELVHVIGNAHIYKNHVEALRDQVTRKPPHPFPRLGKDFACHIESLAQQHAPWTDDGEQALVHTMINDFKKCDFSLDRYEPLPIIQMSMAT